MWGYYGDSKDDMGEEGTPTWDVTYQMKLHVPQFVVWYTYGGLALVGGGGQRGCVI